MKTFRQFREETMEIPVIPHKPNILQKSFSGVKNFLKGFKPKPPPDNSTFQLEPSKKFYDINKAAQQSTKRDYPSWWKQKGPAGTQWYGNPKERRDLTNDKQGKSAVNSPKGVYPKG